MIIKKNFAHFFLCLFAIFLVTAWGCKKSDLEPQPDKIKTIDFRAPVDSGEVAQVVPDEYIVLFRNDVPQPAAIAQQMAEAHGIELRHTYGTAVKGFSGKIPAGRLNALSKDPRVVQIEQVRIERLVMQSLPTGIDRIEADRNPTVAIGDDQQSVQVNHHVAIIDTGIDGDHPDLNVAGGVNFASGSTNEWDDTHGHGTHVAGTVGAIDNGIGVAGVAPGVSLHAVRVCGNNGCWTSDMIAGIDWVADQKSSGAIDFAVANMSISTPDDDQPCNGGSDALHKAICALVSEGVVFSLAAGNDNREKKAYPEVMAVAAVADYDGIGSNLGTPTCRQDEDDTRANFSNYGLSIDIAAPGVCIYSTWTGGGYNTISGTSMAAPHVTGAVALYLHANGMSPAQDGVKVDEIEAAILNAGLEPITPAQKPDCSYIKNEPTPKPAGVWLFVNGPAFSGDGTCDDGSGAFNEAPVVSISSPADGAGFNVGDAINFSGSATDTEDGDITSALTWTSSIDGQFGAGGSFTSSSLNAGNHTITAEVTDSDGAVGSASIAITVNSATLSITDVTPDIMGAPDQEIVTVSGSGIQDGATVSLESGSGPRPSVTILSYGDGSFPATSIECEISTSAAGPPKPREWKLRVTNPDGSTVVWDGVFTVDPNYSN